MKKSEKISSARAEAERKQKNISFAADHGLIAQIDGAASATKVSRSWLIREVLSGWLADKSLESSHD